MPECFLYETILIFCNLAFQNGCNLSLLKKAQNMKMTTSQYRLMDFDQIYVKVILALSCFKIRIDLSGWHQLLKIKKKQRMKLEKSLNGIVPALCYNNLCIKPF